MGFNELINPIAETVRNSLPSLLGGQQNDNSNPSTPFYQPDTIEQDSKTLLTNNKTFNEDTPEQLKELVSSSIANGSKEGDRHFYIMEDEFGQQKIGTSKGSVYERYAEDPAFQGFKVIMDERVSNANEIERRFQGNKGFLNARTYDFGESSQGPLSAGNTELYDTAKSPMVLNRLSETVSKMKAPQQQLASDMINIAEKAFSKKPTSDGSIKQNEILSTSNKKREEEHSLFSLDTWKKAGEQILEMNKTAPTGEFANDVYQGSLIGVNKLGGGVSGLLGLDDAKQHFKEQANSRYNAVNDKDGAGMAIGEILPEIGLPAGMVAKGATKAGRIATSALTAGATNASIEAIKAQSDIKVGDDQHILMAGGIGAVMGGLVGAITKNPKLGKEIGEVFEKGTPAERQAILDEYPQVKGHLAKYVEKQQAKKDMKVPTKEKTIQEEVTKTKEVTTKAEGKAEVVTETPKVETEVIKGKNQGNVKISTNKAVDKSGNKQKNDTLAKQEAMGRNSEVKVSDPRVHTGKELDEQVAVPKTDESYSTQLGWDFRGRTYDENGKAINSQGGNESKFSQSIQPQTKIENVLSEIERRMKLYDNNQALRTEYNGKETSKAQTIANRRLFKKDNLFEIANNKNLTPRMQKEAMKRAKRIREVRVAKQNEDVAINAEQKFDDQFEVSTPREELQARHEKLSGKKLSDGDIKHRNNLEAKFKENGTDKKIVDTAKKMIDDTRELALKATVEAEEIAKGLGKKYKPELKDKQLGGVQSDIRSHTEIKDDLARYEDGEISLMDLRDRITKRITDDEFSKTKMDFKDNKSYHEWKEADDKLHDDLGINRRTVEAKKESDNTPDADTIEKAQVKSIETNAKNHQSRLTAINNGKADLNAMEKKLLADGANPGDIAQLSTPLGRNDDAVQVRADMTTKLITNFNNNARVKNGLPTKEAEVTTVDIKSTDTTTDFSNSVGQNVAILLKDLSLGDFTKMSGKSDDLRSRIAERATAMLGRDISKADIKPLFMQQMYGQLEKGLIKTIDGDKELFKAYDKVMKEEFPAFSKFSDTIYDLGAKSDGKFKYTLPDGVEIKFDLLASHRATVKSTDGKTTQNIAVTTKGYDNYARALAPNIMHSIDGYIIRQIAVRADELGMNTRTIHDALTFRNEHTDAVLKIANDVQADMMNMNILDDIMNQLGHTGESLTVNTMKDTDVRASFGKSMDYEHIAGQIEEMKVRDLENQKLIDDEYAIKEFMASGNVKLSGHNQLIDHMSTEAGLNSGKYAIARDTDDVYERAMASALQGKNLPYIKAPKGMTNPKLWTKIQKDIRREARAKAERNKMLKNVVQGERKFFDNNGKWMHSDKKTYQEILKEENITYKNYLKDMNTRTKKALDTFEIKTVEYTTMQNKTITVPDYEAMFNKVASWKADKVLTPKEARIANLISDISSGPKVKLNSSSHWDEVFKSSEVYRQYNSLEAMRNKIKSDSYRKAENIATRIKKISKEDQKEIQKLLDSDYEVIRGMTKEQGDKLWKDNKELRDIVWKEIYAGAKALKSNANQTGAYKNNSLLIAKQYKLDPSTAKVIDQLISIRAMNKNDAWNAVKKTEDEDFVLDLMAKNRMDSEVLFKSNPEKMIKGYRPEVYLGNKKLNDDGTVSYDADANYQAGLVGNELQNKKIGKVYEGDIPTFKDYNEKIDFMFKNNLKETNGEFRKVAQQDTRDKLGQTNDMSEVLSEMVRATSEKISSESIIMKAMEDVPDILSKTKKEGMIPLTKEQKNLLPFALRSEIDYINPDFMNKMLGRVEPRLFAKDTSSQLVKIADRVLKNLGTAFKQNVVLKNPASYMNATLVNQTIGLTAGIRPDKLVKYQAEAIRDMKEVSTLLEKVNRLQATGKKVPASLQKKLDNNLLYRMEKLGLSTNKVEGVLGDDDLLGSMMKDSIPNVIRTPFAWLNLNQKTAVGKASLSLFSSIDTMGRYTLAKHFMEGNKVTEEAVQKANDLFGNMDKMVHPLIDKLDSYGIAPFLKWFTLTSPQLMKTVKENPIKAMTLGLSLFLLGQEMDLNLGTVNPIEAMIDFTEGSTPMATMETLEARGFEDTVGNRMLGAVLPNYIKNAIKDKKYYTGLGKLAKKRVEYKPFKGFTQDMVDTHIRGMEDE